MNNERLVIVWTSNDKDVAMNMALMYAYNAKSRGWWNELTFVVWGPSAKLLSEDGDLQEQISMMLEAGVDVFACKTCADRYGVGEKLEDMGIKVIKMGIPLTEYLKAGIKVLTV